MVADYDEMQLRISQALTEVVRRIDATDGSPLAVCVRAAGDASDEVHDCRRLAVAVGFTGHLRCGATFVLMGLFVSFRCSAWTAMEAGQLVMESPRLRFPRTSIPCMASSMTRIIVMEGSRCVRLSAARFLPWHVGEHADVRHSAKFLAQCDVTSSYEGAPGVHRDAAVRVPSLDLLEDVERLRGGMSSHDVAVRRVNIEFMITSMARMRNENAAQLRLLPGNPLFLEAHVGGGIRSSLAFRASDWDRYASAVRLYDRLMRAQAGEGRQSRMWWR